MFVMKGLDLETENGKEKNICSLKSVVSVLYIKMLWYWKGHFPACKYFTSVYFYLYCLNNSITLSQLSINWYSFM